MALEAVKIPQNVYVEDRIIGPVTLRQIFLTLGGGGVSYAIYAAVKQAGKLTLVTGAMSWIPLIIMAAFAFLKINGISLLRFLLLTAEKTNKPTMRYWQPREGISISPRNFVPRNSKEKSSFSHSQEEHDEIAELSSVLDSGPVFEKHKGTASSGSTLPIRKERIQAEASKATAVDTVTAGATARPAAEPAAGAVQDIVPPKANAR